jgi:hypothetical protein
MPTTVASTDRPTLTRLPRTTGALSGLFVVLLGVWGALIPFIGPYFHYAFGSYHSWHYSSNRLWLDIIPGAVAVVGGLMLLRSTRRTEGLIGGWLAVAAGAWFAIGPTVFLLWHHSINPIGRPMGGYTRQALEWLGYFYGLGALIIALSAFAMGRYFSRPRLIEEPVVAAEDAAAVHEERKAARRGTVATGGPVAADRAVDEPVAAREDPVVANRASDPVVADRAADPVVANRSADPVVADRSADPVVTNRADTPVTTGRSTGTTSATGAPVATAPVTTGSRATTSYGRRPGLLSRLRGRE